MLEEAPPIGTQVSVWHCSLQVGVQQVLLGAVAGTGVVVTNAVFENVLNNVTAIKKRRQMMIAVDDRSYDVSGALTRTRIADYDPGTMYKVGRPCYVALSQPQV
jgi:hypothetical protein